MLTTITSDSSASYRAFHISLACATLAQISSKVPGRRENAKRSSHLPVGTGQPWWHRGSAVKIFIAEWDLLPKPMLSVHHEGELPSLNGTSVLQIVCWGVWEQRLDDDAQNKGWHKNKSILFIFQNRSIDRASASKTVDLDSIPDRVKPKTRKIKIHSFPGCRLTLKGTVWSHRV